MAEKWGGGMEERSYYTFYNRTRAFKHCFSLILSSPDWTFRDHFSRNFKNSVPSEFRYPKILTKNKTKKVDYIYISYSDCEQWLLLCWHLKSTAPDRRVLSASVSHSLKNSSIKNLSFTAKDRQHSPQFQLLPILSTTLNFPSTFRLQKQALHRPSPLRWEFQVHGKKSRNKSNVHVPPPPTWSQINADFA